MFKNYLKTAWRSLMRNKLSAIINILGLSIALGSGIVIYTFIEFSLNRDNFHAHAEEVFLLEGMINRNGNEQIWGITPAPLGPALQADFPQIKRMVRIMNEGAVVRYGDKVLEEGVRFVNPGFLDMFTFDLEQGDKSVLQDPGQIVVSHDFAKKYFGDESPIGKQLAFTFNDTTERSFFVGAVARDFNPRATFSFNVLVNYTIHDALYPDVSNNWKRYTTTFIQVAPEDLESVKAGSEKYLAVQNEARPDYPVERFLFDNLLELSENSRNVWNDISHGVHRAAFYTLSLIGIFLLALACFNYINISIASAARRLKEIGIRKVIGSSRQQIISQFLTENLIICLFAMVLGGILAKFMFMPGFNKWLGMGEVIPLTFEGNPGMWVFLLGLLVFTGLAAGAYPSFYISSFRTVEIFKGKLSLGRRSLFTKSLLVVQFLLSFLLITAGVVFSENSRYQESIDWGYNQDQVIVLRVEGPRQYKIMEDVVKQLPQVKSYAGSKGHIAGLRYIDVINYAGKDHEVSRFEVGFDYLETMGLRLKEGRFFDRKRQSDREQSLVVNEKMVEYLGLKDPLGEQISIDTVKFNIVGIVEDFHYEQFFDPIEPLFFVMGPDEEQRYLSLLVDAGQVVQTHEYLKTQWAALIPSAPFDGFFQDQVFDDFFQETAGITDIFLAVAIMALLLSSMGLFGLVSLTVAARMKEFSIRKVLGATMAELGRLINQEYIWLMLIASILAVPLGYFALSGLLDDIFAFRMPLGPFPFFAAGMVIVVASLLTVSSHLLKVSKANPVDALREE